MPTTTIQLVIFLALGVLGVKSFHETSDVGLNTVQIIENHGYVCETHYIETEDGYILTYHRIPHGINENGTDSKKPVALLVHGLISSSADFVNMGPQRSLAYILADAGYDVWLANSRGNFWSRNHTTLDIVTDAAKFFNFSWHEMGYYDLPASIDYILNLVGDDSLYYIGHSQGCTQFFVLSSTRPEYNAKIKLASLMAPASLMEHRKFDILSLFIDYIYEIEALLFKYKIYEIPFLDLVRLFGMNECGNPDFAWFCVSILNSVGAGVDNEEIDLEMLPVITTNAPSNASVKQALHYGQNIKNGGFSFYDYGAEKNMELYGNETAPQYDWSKMSAPIALYYGKNDNLVPFDDVLNVVTKLPNLVHNYPISYELFNHIDFIFAKNVVSLLYDDLITVMQTH